MSGATNVTINNAGTIKSTANGNHGVEIWGASTVDKITNTGLIEGSSSGVSVTSASTTLKNLENSGTIKGGSNGIKVDNGGKLETLNNTGTIIGNSVNNGWYDAGIYVSNGSIDTINNSGFIQGTTGIYAYGNIGTLINNGYIKSTGKDSYSGGVKIEQGATIESIVNIGTIDADSYGLNVSYGKFGTVEIKDGGKIIAGRDGVVIGQYQGLESLKIDGEKSEVYGKNNGLSLGVASYVSSGITISNGGKLYGGEYGIYLENAASINNSITLDGENSLIGGGNIGIKNNGNISNGISLSNGATIAALTFSEDGNSYTYNKEGTAILNEGTIKGNINLDKESKIIGAIDNKNTIGGNISLDNKSYITSINNEKTIQGSIDLKNKSHIDSIINSGTIEKGIKLDDSTITSIENTETGKTNLDLSNNSVVDLVINNGEMEITRDDSSLIKAFGNNGNVKSEFKNDGVMTAVNNSENAIMEQGLSNSGAIDALNNAGTIAS
ncbi:hypothetical protein L8V77_06430, partial [Campylobacter sp. IFREMER_LSEM_CL2127]|nr:hypothetical protein [Campylobacter sp. IFREMER_LSEM_CL2127]